MSSIGTFNSAKGFPSSQISNSCWTYVEHSHKQTKYMEFSLQQTDKSRKKLLHKLIGPVREYHDFLIDKRGLYDHKPLLGKVAKLNGPDDNLKE